MATRPHRIGVVLNANAGGFRRNPARVEALRSALGARGNFAATRSPDELADAARAFERDGVTVLAIAGGDGSASVTLSTFAQTLGEDALPPVALLRGGTMNTVANGLGLPRGRPPKMLAALLRRLDDGAPLTAHRHSTLRVGDRFGFLFGTGVVSGFLREYYAGGDPTPVHAASVLARGVASAVVGGPMIRRLAAPCRAAVRFDDGEAWPVRDYLTVAAGTVDQIGLGFRPFLRCAERDGAFHLLGIHATALGFALELPRVRLARPMRPGRAFEKVTSHATITFEGGSGHYMLDGELFETTAPLTLRAGPAVSIVR